MEPGSERSAFSSASRGCDVAHFFEGKRESAFSSKFGFGPGVWWVCCLRAAGSAVPTPPKSYSPFFPSERCQEYLRI